MDRVAYVLADADPVQAPDGNWLVFPAGQAGPDDKPMVNRYIGSEEDGNATAESAW